MKNLHENKNITFVTFGGGAIFLSIFFRHAIYLKEIRLYQDRLVRAWRLHGEKEVRLTDANVTGSKVLVHNLKRMWDKDMNRFSGLIKGILYDENLADREDV